MLVLSRKANETVVISDMQIEVTVVEIRGDRVKLAFTAPESISIHRREVYEAIERDKKRNGEGKR